MRAIAGGLIWIAAAAAALAAESTSPSADTGGSMPRSRVLAGGYLAPTSIPSSVAIVPPPPAPGSAAMARDEEINQKALAAYGSPRWQLAARDAVLSIPALTETFSCALNAPISEERTPRVTTLLRRALADAGRSTMAAKQQYQRARPFMVNGKPTCTAQAEDILRRDGSYPSGHSAIGWVIGLVLSELAPDRADALIARGREFGQSRVVCNVHWQSDVAEGQIMGAAVLARMHAESAFRADLDAAREELTAVRAQAASAARDCKLETQALTVSDEAPK